MACSGGNGGDKISNQAIADALRGFSEAFSNGDVDTVATYWSKACSEEDRSTANSASTVLADLLPGEYELNVNAELLVMDDADGKHVTVPLAQPAGALVATTAGAPYAEGLPFEAPVTFASEGGDWKVDSCVLFVNDDG